jgi:hypothetical protein
MNIAPRSKPLADTLGPVWTWVTDPSGCRYLSDEFHHRIVVEEPGGKAWSFGERGGGASEFRFPRGLALVPARTPEATRLFVADTWNHRIQVFNGRGELVMAFGGSGDGRGQFRAPSDVVIAQPELPWEGAQGASSAPVLVVADQWNARLQVFDLDGLWLATIGGRRAGRSARQADELTGWPFFRAGDPTLPRDPARLSWQAPWLVVLGGNGRSYQVDLASALLPTAEEWKASATPAELEHARRYFGMLKGNRRALPADLLAQFVVAPAAR